MGLYEQALASLNRSVALNGNSPLKLAYVTLTQHKLGHQDEARVALRSFRAAMRSREFSGDKSLQDMVKTAEKLIGPERPAL